MENILQQEENNNHKQNLIIVETMNLSMKLDVQFLSLYFAKDKSEILGNYFSDSKPQIFKLINEAILNTTYFKRKKYHNIIFSNIFIKNAQKYIFDSPELWIRKTILSLLKENAKEITFILSKYVNCNKKSLRRYFCNPRVML